MEGELPKLGSGCGEPLWTGVASFAGERRSTCLWSLPQLFALIAPEPRMDSCCGDKEVGSLEVDASPVGSARLAAAGDSVKVSPGYRLGDMENGCVAAGIPRDRVPGEASDTRRELECSWCDGDAVARDLSWGLSKLSNTFEDRRASFSRTDDQTGRAPGPRRGDSNPIAPGDSHCRPGDMARLQAPGEYGGESGCAPGSCNGALVCGVKVS